MNEPILPEREDILSILTSRPTGIEVLDCFWCGYEGCVERQWCAVLGSEKLLTVFYWQEPKPSAIPMPPREVMEAVERRIERWRNDPRPWLVRFMDHEISTIESKDSDGLWQKMYIGSRKSIDAVRATEESPTEDPVQVDRAHLESIFKGWFRIP